MNALHVVTAVPAVARAGARIALASATALGAAARLRRLGGGDPAALRRERALFLRDLFGRVVTLHGIEIRGDGPRPLGPALLASNHVSYLDPIVVGSLIPCVPISKLDVSAWPVVGGFARDLGVLFVERGNGHSGMRTLRDAARTLADGVPVLNFPEGTTTRGDRVLRFREGLFAIARRAEVPVVPLGLSYDPRELAWVDAQTFIPHYLRLAGSVRARATVRFGSPLVARAFPSAAALAAAAHDEVESLLGGSGGTARSA